MPDIVKSAYSLSLISRVIMSPIPSSSFSASFSVTLTVSSLNSTGSLVFLSCSVINSFNLLSSSIEVIVVSTLFLFLSPVAVDFS